MSSPATGTRTTTELTPAFRDCYPKAINPTMAVTTLIYSYLPDYDSPHRQSLRALRMAVWEHLARIRDWFPPWKQQLLQPLTPSSHTAPIRHPLRLLSILTVRRERFQWKRKMTKRAQSTAN